MCVHGRCTLEGTAPLISTGGCLILIQASEGGRQWSLIPRLASSGIGLTDLGSDAMDYIKTFAGIVGAHYPERLFRHAPSLPPVCLRAPAGRSLSCPCQARSRACALEGMLQDSTFWGRATWLLPHLLSLYDII